MQQCLCGSHSSAHASTSKTANREDSFVRLASACALKQSHSFSTLVYLTNVVLNEIQLNITHPSIRGGDKYLDRTIESIRIERDLWVMLPERDDLLLVTNSSCLNWECYFVLERSYLWVLLVPVCAQQLLCGSHGSAHASTSRTAWVQEGQLRQFGKRVQGP